jgi:hypothetical protein
MVTADLLSGKVTALNWVRFLSPRGLPLMGRNALHAENAWRMVVGLPPLGGDKKTLARLTHRNDMALVAYRATRPLTHPWPAQPEVSPIRALAHTLQEALR